MVGAQAWGRPAVGSTRKCLNIEHLWGCRNGCVLHCPLRFVGAVVAERICFPHYVWYVTLALLLGGMVCLGISSCDCDLRVLLAFAVLSVDLCLVLVFLVVWFLRLAHFVHVCDAFLFWHVLPFLLFLPFPLFYGCNLCVRLLSLSLNPIRPHQPVLLVPLCVVLFPHGLLLTCVMSFLFMLTLRNERSWGHETV